MTNRMYGALVASLGAIALLIATSETFARTGAGSRGAFASTHSHRLATQSLRHHRRNNVGTYWPAVGDYYGPSNVEPMVDATQPTPGETQYTNTYAVPWDWAHRFPPLVAPSERPYVSSCTTETVTVAGRGGKEQTVNVTRCF